MDQYFSLLTQAIFLSFISNFPSKKTHHCDHYALQKMNVSGNVIYKMSSINFGLGNVKLWI